MSETHAMPMIRLQVDRMKHTVMVALQEYAAQLDTDIQAAVENFCTADRIKSIVTETVDAAIDEVLRDETRRFFVYGDGRKTIRDAVEQRLRQRLDAMLGRDEIHRVP